MTRPQKDEVGFKEWHDHALGTFIPEKDWDKVLVKTRREAWRAALKWERERISCLNESISCHQREKIS